jgi:hypothetical protein
MTVASIALTAGAATPIYDLTSRPAAVFSTVVMVEEAIVIR